VRTRITGGWVVGFERGTHVLWREGVVVIEDDRVLHVGPPFEGRVDREIDARGMLVAPGFVDCHVHSGHRASHRLITDVGRPDYYGQPFLDISVPRAGTRVGGDPRYLRPDARDADAGTRLHAEFTVAELLRSGTTSFMEFGSQLRVQEALLDEVERRGIRAWLGPGFDSGRWVGDADTGRLTRVVDEAAGWKEFEAACAFIRRVHGTCEGRVSGLLVPREVETCALDLLRATRDAAAELGVPITIHAAYSVVEFHDIVREHRLTPIELLESVGLLGPGVTIGHGNLPAETYRFFAGGRDVELMGRHGVSISHCPVNIARRGRTLDSWRRYRDAGVNIALGSDTYPRDMIMQMRMASYFGKVTSGDLRAASAAEVFAAATLGGARALGREDLGRLAPGAKADVVIVDIHGGDTLRWGPVRDPIKSLVECGIADDVETVLVDGVVRVEQGRIPGVDLPTLRARAQAAGEEVWARLAEWDPLRRPAAEMSPWSFPLMNAPPS
jgi:5-methylthioadenosine/S-adenosylhomocysteine deaminase